MSTIALDPVHDARHELRNQPHARESLVWMLQLPDEEVAAIIYTWVGGDGKAGSAFMAYGPSVGDEPIFEKVDGIAVPGEQGFDDWQVGELRARQSEPLQTAEVTYAGGRVGVEYRFDAIHPAYAYSSHPDGCPPFLADDRFEQSGRVTGVLRLDGREIDFDTTGHRDHSWGTRDWDASQHWKWIECQAGPETAVHFIEPQGLGRTWLRGYVLLDGEMSPVTAVDLNFEHDERWVHNAIDAVVHDEAERSVEVKLRGFASFDFPIAENTTCLEVSMRAEIDGRPGVGHAEMQWPNPYLAHLRGTAA